MSEKVTLEDILKLIREEYERLQQAGSLQKVFPHYTGSFEEDVLSKIYKEASL